MSLWQKLVSFFLNLNERHFAKYLLWFRSLSGFYCSSHFKIESMEKKKCVKFTRNEFGRPKKNKKTEPNCCRHLCPNNRNINKTQRFVFFMDAVQFTVIRWIVAIYANRIFDAITCLNAPEKIIHLIRTWSRYIPFSVNEDTNSRANERARENQNCI